MNLTHLPKGMQFRDVTLNDMLGKVEPGGQEPGMLVGHVSADVTSQKGD